jgi:hypothetical protein
MGEKSIYVHNGNSPSLDGIGIGTQKTHLVMGLTVNVLNFK